MDVSVNLLPPSTNPSLLNIQSQSASNLLPSAADLLSSNPNELSLHHLSDPDASLVGGDSTGGAGSLSASSVQHSGGSSQMRMHQDGNGGGGGGGVMLDRMGQAGFLVKNEIISDHDRLMSSAHHQSGPPQNMQQGISQQAAANQGMIQSDSSSLLMGHNNAGGMPQHHMHHSHLMGHHMHMQHPHHLFASAELAAAAAAVGGDMRMHYGTPGLPSSSGGDCMSTQKAVAFLAGPRERIHVLGNPVEHCPRCQHEGLGTTSWRPHRHIGELKIRYICERHFDDLESNHHFDIPLCPICNQVLYLYDFNNMLGVSNARRLHKYVLKCANRHVLPLLDLFCQTKKGGERCNANFKLQWCYGTMVKRCEAQKNRDHDLWWVRYKNEWKQRRTIIRYKKDFLSHLTDAQRSLLLGLGLEGEPPPDPKSALGPTFDALVSSVGGSPSGPKIKKRVMERGGSLGPMDGRMGLDGYDMNPNKQPYRPSGGDFGGVSLADYSGATSRMGQPSGMARSDGSGDPNRRGVVDDPTSDSLRYVMGAVVLPAARNQQEEQNPLMVYLNQQQGSNTNPIGGHSNNYGGGFSDQQLGPSHMIVTGTPTPPLPTSGVSPVAVSVVGEVISASGVA